jgi:hypothetical protein
MGKTSSAVHNRYKAKTYKRIIVEVKKDIAAAFDEKIKREGTTKAGWIKERIDEYLNG